MRSFVTLLFTFALSAPVIGQQSSTLPDRGDSFVAMTRSFAFYSDATLNLHDFLTWNARSPRPVDAAPACVAELPAEQRTAYERAGAYYDSTFTSPSGERLALALRFRLAGYPEVNLLDASVLDGALAALEPALPAYTACWWEAHDARNRRWIAELLPLLIAHEGALHERLAELYGEELSRPLPVDVVGYAGFVGASSVANPHHILVSGARESISGHSALEIVFHEASHTVFGPRTEGGLWQAIQAASAAAETPLPRDSWHTILFFTTGRAVQAYLAEVGVDDYQPYIYSEGLFDRVWADFRDPLESVWQPYVDGDLSMEEAARRIVAALGSLPAGE